MANNFDIPDEVVQFVHDHVTSAAQLEVLLLLAQKSRDHWSAADVNRELRSQQDLVARSLAELHASGLLVMVNSDSAMEPSDLCYRYQPSDPALDKAVGVLIATYRTRRHTVLDLIYSKHLPPRPDNSLQVFADAFRLRPKKDD